MLFNRSLPERRQRWEPSPRLPHGRKGGFIWANAEALGGNMMQGLMVMTSFEVGNFPFTAKKRLLCLRSLSRKVARRTLRKG